MKKYFIFSVLAVVLSDTLYHFASKSLPSNVSAFSIFFFVYLGCGLLAFLLGLGLDLKSKTRTQKTYFKNKWMFIFIIGILGFDLGYLFLYRIGGDLSYIYILTMPLKAIALLLVGKFAYKEKLSKQNIFGMLISTIGLILLSI